MPKDFFVKQSGKRSILDAMQRHLREGDFTLDIAEKLLLYYQVVGGVIPDDLRQRLAEAFRPSWHSPATLTDAKCISLLQIMLILLKSGFTPAGEDLADFMKLCWSRLPDTPTTPPQGNAAVIQHLAALILSCFSLGQWQLNPDKCYAIPATMQTNANTCLDGITFESDWKSRLATYLPTHELRHRLMDQHLSRYRPGTEFELAFKILYARLSGKLDHKLHPLSADEKSALQTKLAEGLEHCADGYLNRILQTAKSLSIPQTLDEYLFRIRMDEMETVIRKIATITQDDIRSGYGFGYEVHKHNSLFVATQACGFGVLPPNPSDPYTYSVTEQQITHIQTEFSEKYHADTIIPLLLKRIRTSLEDMGYHGRLELADAASVGYASPLYSKFTQHLQQLLGLPGDHWGWVSSIMLQQEKSTGEPVDEDEYRPFIDINWQFVEKKLRAKLLVDAYLNPTCRDQKTVVKSVFMRLQKLILNGNIEELTQELSQSQAWPRDLREAVFTHQSRDKAWNLLMHATTVQIKAAPVLLETIKKLAPEIQAQIFKQACSKGWNSLMDVARNHPDMVRPLLAAIDALPEPGRSDAMKTVFQQATLPRRYNALMFAAARQASSTESILRAIKTLDESFQNAILSQRNSKGESAFEIAAMHQKKTVACFLEHLSDKQLSLMLPNDLEILAFLSADLAKAKLEPEQGKRIARLMLACYIQIKFNDSTSPRFFSSPAERVALLQLLDTDNFKPQSFRGKNAFVTAIGELAFGPEATWPEPHPIARRP